MQISKGYFDLTLFLMIERKGALCKVVSEYVIVLVWAQFVHGKTEAMGLLTL